VKTFKGNSKKTTSSSCVRFLGQKRTKSYAQHYDFVQSGIYLRCGHIYCNEDLIDVASVLPKRNTAILGKYLKM